MSPNELHLYRPTDQFAHEQEQKERVIFPPGYIVEIVGNVASGKSTTSVKLPEVSNLTYVDVDPFAENPFLLQYMKDPSRWAFQTGLQFSLHRSDKIPEIATRLTQGPLILDQGFDMGIQVYSRLSYLNKEMTDDEWRLLQAAHEKFMGTLPPIATTIFIDVPVPTLLERIKTRGREHELEGYTDEYVQNLQAMLNIYKAELLAADQRTVIATYHQLEQEMEFHTTKNDHLAQQVFTLL